MEIVIVGVCILSAIVFYILSMREKESLAKKISRVQEEERRAAKEAFEAERLVFGERLYDMERALVKANADLANKLDVENTYKERIREIQAYHKSEMAAINSRLDSLVKSKEEREREMSGKVVASASDAAKVKGQLVELQEAWDASKRDMEKLRVEHKDAIAVLKAEHKVTLAKKLELTRQQTRAVNFGFTSERLTPLLASNHNIKDIRYFGETMDFIVVDGMEEDKDEFTLILADAKSSVKVADILANKDKWETHKTMNPITALLTGANGKRQQKIVKAIQEGRVKFAVWMSDTDGNFDVYEVSADSPCPVL